MKALSKILTLLLIAIAGVAFMVLLFMVSEKKARYSNSFIRRFPPHMALLSQTRTLEYNSFYFAGYGNGRIYLGNSTAPFLVTVLDSALKTVAVSHIELDRPQEIGLPQLRVNPPYFYFYEGAKPYVYSGSTADWHAKLQVSSFVHLFGEFIFLGIFFYGTIDCEYYGFCWYLFCTTEYTCKGEKIVWEPNKNTDSAHFYCKYTDEFFYDSSLVFYL